MVNKIMCLARRYYTIERQVTFFVRGGAFSVLGANPKEGRLLEGGRLLERVRYVYLLALKMGFA